jgi:3',5'-cyclic-AMP phosphodiesterase
MSQYFKMVIVIIIIFFAGCKCKPANDEKNGKALINNEFKSTLSPEYTLTGLHDETDSIMLRVAILGDAEPKPLAEFPNMDAAVEHINVLMQEQPIDFVIGVGDIAHKGTEIQYQAATEVLLKLKAPFYPIMGNEEHGSTVKRYIHYAQQWNSVIVSPSYVINHEKLAFVFASPDHGRDFDDKGAMWIRDQVHRLAPKPVVLVVHGAQAGVYPENAEKGISNQLFREQVISQSNLAVVISGDLHMDMDRVDHSKKIGHVHYLHIPALERTKIPDETNHTAMFRVMTISRNGNVAIDTYAVGDKMPRIKHTYKFALTFSE